MPGSFSAFSNESEDEEEESDDEDDYGLPSGLPPRNQSQSDDDDVPLARSIPTALKAQQSIRMKDREARAKRRQEREARAAARNQQRLLQQAATATRSSPASSPPEATLHTSRSLRRPGVHSTSQPSTPFAIDELNKRFENMQTRTHPDSRSPPPSGDGAFRTDVVPLKDAPPATRTLRPMRSFHKPEPKQTTDDFNAPPLPTSGEAKLTRNTTRARARSTASREDHPGNFVSLSQARTVPIPAPVEEPTTAKIERKRTVKTAKPDGTRSARTSAEHSRSAPPLLGPAEVARQNKVILTQQRIFIGDRQRFVVVEVSHSTTAGDVIRMVEAQGAFKEWRGSGGWMLFEIAQDFGMERPVRSFELLTDIEASWNKDKLVNVFLLKLTPLAPLLSLSALPSSSPTHSGYIEWESKRGKWNKRYLMLKEHSLWLSKRDNGRDEILLCSLSNFDAYQITRLVRAPKEFTFAVKSTDNLSYFENTADYLHIFSCKKDAGEKWMEKILLARSYILHQERHILTKPSANAHPKSASPQSGSTGLSRSLTKRTGPTLVNVNPANVFEPGSLLRG
ncbi:hypothetical protein EV360DRAFT_31559 [Lentinula raphanica]|nr:hypothetical protein EV360DRAFT_31559 [Lentinula raphanica]